jgi:hypothetical protein
MADVEGFRMLEAREESDDVSFSAEKEDKNYFN